MVLPALSTVVAVLIIYGLLFALVHRPWTAAAITIYVIGFVLLLSVVKQSYLGVAATLADVVFFLLHPRENFHLFVHYPLLGMVLLLVIIGFASCLVAGIRLEQPVHRKAKPAHHRWMRITAASASLVLLTSSVFITTAASHAQVTDDDPNAAFDAMYALQDTYGVMNRLNAFFTNRSMEASMPARHMQRLFTIDGSTNTATESNRTRPDILMILEESTFDATLIGDCSADECDVAMLHPLSIATRTQQGPLMVHSTGGGTWLSEFAFMSGFDWRLFGRGGAYAPVSLAPRLQQALPARLRALGYRTVAVCPTGGNFLSAQTAYQYYGFDEFYSAQDLKLDDDWTEIYDHTMFDNALKIALRNNDPRPVFVFVLTIRNHGPHGDGAVDLPDNLVHAKQKYGAEIADYLGRMRDSSDDFVHVASTWLKSDRPRVIGWFGDHQPEAAWDITRHPERLQRNHVASNATEGQIQYLTHYQLSANFGEHEQRISQEAMDISYLGSQLLSFAELPLTPSNNAAKETADKCHGLMISCANHELVNAYVSYRIHELREIN